MPRAFSYLRFSTKDQLKGDSQRRQFELAKNYCKAHQLELYEEPFQDLGISGYKDVVRPDLSNLLTAIEEGRIRKGDYVILEAMDRLSRQGITKTQEILNKILSAGVYVVDIYNNLKLDKSSLNNLEYAIRVAVAADLSHKESEQKSKRLSDAWKNKQVKAKAEKVPKTKMCPSWLTLSEDRKEYIADPVKVKIINRIFELSASGLGRRKICQLLSEEKVPHIYTGSRNSEGRWYPSYLLKIFTNGAVIGRLVPTKQDNQTGKRIPDFENIIEDYYPQIVSDELYFRVNSRIKGLGKTSGGRKGANMPNLLQGIVKCQYCGRSMTYRSKNKKKREIYFRCSENYLGRCVNSTNFRYDLVEAAVIQSLKTENIAKEPTAYSSAVNEIYTIKNKIENLTTRISNLTDAAGVPEVATKLNNLNEERQHLSSELEKLKGNEEGVSKEVLKDAWSKLDRLKIRDEERSRIQINNALKAVGNEFIFSKDSFTLSRRVGNRPIRLLQYSYRPCYVSCAVEEYYTVGDESESVDKLIFSVELKNGDIKVSISNQ